MMIQPYLHFDGRCEEALDFYRDELGATKIVLMRFSESPDSTMCPVDPAHSEKVMHASFNLGESTIMASDGRCLGKPHFAGFSLSLPARDETDAQRLFAALSAGGEVIMPLTKTFYSPSFGMVADRFGVPWMVIVPQECGGE